MKEIDWMAIMSHAAAAILVMAFAAFVGTIVYGSSPIDEIPAWALPFMF